MGTRFIPTADAGPLVRDVMLLGPTTVAPTATAADARRILESPRQRALIICDGDRYVGAVTREALDGVDDGAELGRLADAGAPTLSPEDPTDSLFAIIERHGTDRIPVVGADGELQGLVCFNRSRGAFCVA